MADLKRLIWFRWAAKSAIGECLPIEIVTLIGNKAYSDGGSRWWKFPGAEEDERWHTWL